MDFPSKYPVGSLEWLIDQYGMILSDVLNYKFYEKGGRNFTLSERQIDYRGKIQECAKAGKKIFASEEGMYICCDGKKVFLMHNIPDLEKILNLAGFDNSAKGKIDPPQIPGVLKYMEDGSMDSNFRLGNKTDSYFSFKALNARKAWDNVNNTRIMNPLEAYEKYRNSCLGNQPQ